jgi:hypothetical protein
MALQTAHSDGLKRTGERAAVIKTAQQEPRSAKAKLKNVSESEKMRRLREGFELDRYREGVTGAKRDLGAAWLEVKSVASRPRFGCYSPLPTWACWGLLGPTVMLVSVWLPASSRLSACYCLDRHCVLKSFATPR